MFRAALCGNPNVGKSTVFNALTGLKQHTGNWSGKTVETATNYHCCVNGGTWTLSSEYSSSSCGSSSSSTYYACGGQGSCSEGYTWGKMHSSSTSGFMSYSSSDYGCYDSSLSSEGYSSSSDYRCTCYGSGETGDCHGSYWSIYEI